MTFLSLRGTLRDERSASSSDVPSFFFFPWPFPIVRFLFPSFEGLFDESFHGEKKDRDMSGIRKKTHCWGDDCNVMYFL